MRAAIPHIERAQRSLEMLRLFAENKGKLGLTRRVPQYYNSLIESVIELQKLLLSDSEYADLVSDNIHHVSKSREFVYDVTTNPKGEMFFSLDALLPLKRMKRRVLVGRGRAAPMIGGHRV
jgi:hypothetical protein